MSVKRTSHFSFNCEASVRELESRGIGGEIYLRGSVTGVVDCEVVFDDSLLLPFFNKFLNVHHLLGRHHHSIHGSAFDAIVIRIVRVTIDLRVKHISSHFEQCNLTNERIRVARESLLEAIDCCLVFIYLHHELHLLNLHGHDAGLKICDVWENREVVLDFEDLVRGVGDILFESIGSGHDRIQLHILSCVRLFQ